MFAADAVPVSTVPSTCTISRLAEQYNFSKYAVALGTSYFTRLCERDALMQAAAVVCPDFQAFAGQPRSEEVSPVPGPGACLMSPSRKQELLPPLCAHI